MNVHKISLILLITAMLTAASPLTSIAWETVFEIRAPDGHPAHEKMFQTLMNPQSTLTVGIEVMGIRIGYDSRNGLAAVIEFW